MKRLTLKGSPREVGAQYGTAARDEIMFSIESYKDIFQQTAGTTWEQSCQTALRWLPVLREKCPEIVHEMEALAEAAGVQFSEILALNLRSEIALTHYTDGCTSIGQTYGPDTFIAQNWDWMESQSCSLVGLEVHLPGKPAFFILAEAGIVGKYGFNDRGVGVCLNALRCGACSTEKLPIHVALRKVLECESFAQARAMLDDLGVASAANLLMADRSKKVCQRRSVTPRQLRHLAQSAGHCVPHEPRVCERGHCAAEGSPVDELFHTARADPGAVRGNDTVLQVHTRHAER